jgi:hypothetical protein
MNPAQCQPHSGGDNFRRRRGDGRVGGATPVPPTEKGCRRPKRPAAKPARLCIARKSDCPRKDGCGHPPRRSGGGNGKSKRGTQSRAIHPGHRRKRKARGGNGSRCGFMAQPYQIRLKLSNLPAGNSVMNWSTGFVRPTAAHPTKLGMHFVLKRPRQTDASNHFQSGIIHPIQAIFRLDGPGNPVDQIFRAFHKNISFRGRADAEFKPRGVQTEFAQEWSNGNGLRCDGDLRQTLRLNEDIPLRTRPVRVCCRP